jgi:predicted transcriptional regulator
VLALSGEGLSEKYAYILLSAEKWWIRRVNKNKAGKTLQSFVRKGAVGPKDAKLILFYVKHPLREIRGSGEFLERIVGDVDKLWSALGHETVFDSYQEYVAFMDGRTRATFIRFRNLQEFPTPIPVKTFSQVIGVSRMPRGGKYISRETVDALV